MGDVFFSERLYLFWSAVLCSPTYWTTQSFTTIAGVYWKFKIYSGTLDALPERHLFFGDDSLLPIVYIFRTPPAATRIPFFNWSIASIQQVPTIESFFYFNYTINKVVWLTSCWTDWRHKLPPVSVAAHPQISTTKTIPFFSSNCRLTFLNSFLSNDSASQ